MNEGLIQNNNQVSDDRMSMAIVNLQAMLNIEDIDKVIKLLEENNWDESQAASAHFAQQMAGAGGQPNDQQMQEDENGVRAPIQQQHDQLIDDSPFAGLFGGMRPARPYANSYNEGQNAANRPQNAGLGDPLMRRALTQRIPRLREPRPQDFKFSLDMVYREEDEDEEQRLIRQQAQRYSLRDYIGYFISSIWYTIKWTITLGGTLANTGYEQQDFGCGLAISQDDRLLASLELDPEQQFFKTCIKSRRQKKPILLILVNNPDDTSQIDIVIQCFAENQGMAQDLIKSRYNLFLVSQEQLDQNLKSSHEYIKLRPADDINCFVIFVKVEQNIAIMNRITQSEMIDSSRLAAVLQEYVGLFDILAEEDPGYRQIQLLQDAGLLPLDAFGEPGPVGRPRGISATIPQEAIDEMLREHPLDNSAPQVVNNVQQEQNVQQPLAEPQPVVEDQEMKPSPKPAPVINLPEEPLADNSDSLEIILRMPVSGERIKRRFLKSDALKLIYDFIDQLQNEQRCTFEGIEGYTSNYQLIQSMPRKVYSDKSKTLEELGFFPRGIMLQIQQIDDEESD